MSEDSFLWFASVWNVLDGWMDRPSKRRGLGVFLYVLQTVLALSVSGEQRNRGFRVIILVVAENAVSQLATSVHIASSKGRWTIHFIGNA